MRARGARLVLPPLLGLAAAFLGPRLTLPRDRLAGQPFAYEAPDGFVELKDPKLAATAEGARAWVLATADPRGFTPRVNVIHSPKRGGVEERELAALAATLPETFADDFTWKERRHETRVRPDGARVGLIEGDCTKNLSADLVGIPLEQKFRMMQIVFPDDTGTTIATATFGEQDAARFEPAFEASILRAKGVAVRVPEPAGWVYAAWGGAGVVLGWLGAALVGREGDAPKPSPSDETSKRAAPPRKEEDEEEDDEDEDDDEGDGK